jgi:hypothetical protein
MKEYYVQVGPYHGLLLFDADLITMFEYKEICDWLWELNIQ